MQQRALTHVDDAIFAAAVDAALLILEPSLAAQGSYAENILNVGPDGPSINNRNATVVNDAQVVAIRAASDAWHVANP